MTNSTSAGGGRVVHLGLINFLFLLLLLRPRPLIHHCPLADPRNVILSSLPLPPPPLPPPPPDTKINDQSQAAADSLTAQLARGNLLFLVYWQIFANILPQSLLSNLVWSVACEIIAACRGYLIYFTCSQESCSESPCIIVSRRPGC